jgi:hypothetical protein
MSKKNKIESDDQSNEKPKIGHFQDGKHVIAVFYKNWMESNLMAHGLPIRSLKSWKAWQVVSKREDVERLISLDAPIRIYIEDGTYGCTER